MGLQAETNFFIVYTSTKRVEHAGSCVQESKHAMRCVHYHSNFQEFNWKTRIANKIKADKKKKLWRDSGITKICRICFRPCRICALPWLKFRVLNEISRARTETLLWIANNHFSAKSTAHTSELSCFHTKLWLRSSPTATEKQPTLIRPSLRFDHRRLPATHWQEGSVPISGPVLLLKAISQKLRPHRRSTH